MKRKIEVLMALTLAMIALLTSLVAGPTVVAAPGSTELERAACTMTDEELLATFHGWRQDRGGQLMSIPNEPNFVGGGLPHAGPWPYLQEIPLFFYGPGFIKPVGKVSGDAHLVDIAPTQAEILNFDGFTAPDGHVLDSILEPERERKTPPKLILTVVWDSAGRDVLDPWPRAWKTLQKLIPKGAWFEDATLNSSPSDTPPSHASIGTGAYPNDHGILDQTQEISGNIITPWGAGPRMLIRPTLADIYDRSMNNEPVVGAIASLGAHLGMLGHGTMWGGGDEDIAINHENLEDEGDEGLEWNLRAPIDAYFRFPRYVNKLPSLVEYNREVDLSDGAADGQWRGHSIVELRNGWDTPARVPYQSKMVETVVKREKFGKDDVPDLLFVNYKTIDNIGHKFSANSLEMSDTLAAQDADLSELIDMLNKRVGKGEWVMILTADHGSQQDPEETGAHPVSPGVLDDALRGEFPGVVKNIRPTEMWVDQEALDKDGRSLIELSEFLLSLTEAQLPDPIDAGDQSKMYQAVFPAVDMKKLSCLRPLLKDEAKATRQQRNILSGKVPSPVANAGGEPASAGGQEANAEPQGAA